ncbi:hypothetical protein [Staphylococcus pseudintermedius]|uniref:hypothetical protein n=1 Tax=Staphylococcus pseudintermedius TaxID=283734 RepID=UPI000C702223|nr:hypothetical protein [Staphylococcus pseudintermedius]POF45484.1 hypothetical protein CYJ00_006920 [Staphylococcus pseudintermedius]
MSKQSDQPEVIDPSDPRYRHPDEINHSQDNTFQNDTGPFRRTHVRTHVRTIGCTPVGCLPGCLFSIILSILLTLLLNLIF